MFGDHRRDFARRIEHTTRLPPHLSAVGIVTDVVLNSTGPRKDDAVRGTEIAVEGEQRRAAAGSHVSAWSARTQPSPRCRGRRGSARHDHAASVGKSLAASAFSSSRRRHDPARRPRMRRGSDAAKAASPRNAATRTPRGRETAPHTLLLSVAASSTGVDGLARRHAAPRGSKGAYHLAQSRDEKRRQSRRPRRSTRRPERRRNRRWRTGR